MTSDVRVLAAIAVGGVLGAEARALLTAYEPSPATGFPVATFAVNVVGSALIGVLMTWIAVRGPVHPLVGPFLGVGVLGGFTTFSAYAVQTQQLVTSGRPLLGMVALVATPVVAIAAVWAGAGLTRSALGRRGAEPAP